VCCHSFFPTVPGVRCRAANITCDGGGARCDEGGVRGARESGVRSTTRARRRPARCATPPSHAVECQSRPRATRIGLRGRGLRWVEGDVWRRATLVTVVLALLSIVILTACTFAQLSDLPLNVRTVEVDLRNEKHLQEVILSQRRVAMVTGAGWSTLPPYGPPHHRLSPPAPPAPPPHAQRHLHDIARAAIRPCHRHARRRHRRRRCRRRPSR
jgi:hypothetical protein